MLHGSLYSLLPFAHALHTALGRDLVSGTGLRWQIPLALFNDAHFLRNDWDAAACHRLLAFPGQVPDEYRGLIQHSIDQHPEQGSCCPATPCTCC